MSDHRARWRELKPAVLVALALFGLYVAAQRGVIASYDGQIMYSVARNLVDHGSLQTGGEDIFGFNTPYAVYGVGLSILMAPAYALERLVGASDPVFATLVNPSAARPPVKLRPMRVVSIGRPSPVRSRSSATASKVASSATAWPMTKAT